MAPDEIVAKGGRVNLIVWICSTTGKISAFAVGRRHRRENEIIGLFRRRQRPPIPVVPKTRKLFRTAQKRLPTFRTRTENQCRIAQAISVLFDPSNSSCYFNVKAPGADGAAFDGSMSGSNEFSTNLEESGNYTAQIYMMRNAARRNETCRFSITFEISG